MLCFFFSLDEEDIIHPELVHCINGTFVLELLAKLLEIGKTYISEQCLTSMNGCSQRGKILAVVSGFDPLPVNRKVFQEIFEDGFCVNSIAFEQFGQKGGIQAFIKNKFCTDLLHGCCNFFVVFPLSDYMYNVHVSREP